jgi:hypothetical protein
LLSTRCPTAPVGASLLATWSPKLSRASTLPQKPKPLGTCGSELARDAMPDSTCGSELARDAMPKAVACEHAPTKAKTARYLWERACSRLEPEAARASTLPQKPKPLGPVGASLLATLRMRRVRARSPTCGSELARDAARSHKSQNRAVPVGASLLATRCPTAPVGASLLAT